MLLVIDKVLTTEELGHILARYAQTQFGDGRVTAGELATRVKRNLQLPERDPETRALAQLVTSALERHGEFVSAALPRVVYPPLFNRYLLGMDFGVHVDNAIRFGAVTLRTDLAGTLFLSNPEDYEGGALIIEDTYGTQRVKLAAGSLVLYPATSLHRVEPVAEGTRDVAVFWVQSLVRDDGQRSLLYQIDQAIQSLRARTPDAPEIAPLVACYHNLLRMWADL
jgi:PKHD-type hydroxylase